MNFLKTKLKFISVALVVILLPTISLAQQGVLMCQYATSSSIIVDPAVESGARDGFFLRSLDEIEAYVSEYRTKNMIPDDIRNGCALMHNFVGAFFYAVPDNWNPEVDQIADNALMSDTIMSVGTVSTL